MFSNAWKSGFYYFQIALVCNLTSSPISQAQKQMAFVPVRLHCLVYVFENSFVSRFAYTTLHPPHLCSWHSKYIAIIPIIREGIPREKRQNPCVFMLVLLTLKQHSQKKDLKCGARIKFKFSHLPSKRLTTQLYAQSPCNFFQSSRKRNHGLGCFQ